MRRIMTCLTVLCVLFASLAAPARAQYHDDRAESRRDSVRSYGGAALGAFGGGALGSSLVAAAGIANPLLAGSLLATSTFAGTFSGAKLGALAAGTNDENTRKKAIWTGLGAVAGSLAGMFFGPSGTVIGKVLGASVGAVAGGLLANFIANKFGDRNRYGSSYSQSDWRGTNNSWDFDNRHSYYPPGDRIRNRSGWDREGYDSEGYDQAGFDREGYDRLGYDRPGADRRGFDRNGYKRVTAGTSTSTGTGSSAGSGTYDPQVYDGYWQSWGVLGGNYPKLGKSHFHFFPPAVQSKSYDRYASAGTAAAPKSDTDLVSLKQEYVKAVERVKQLTASGGSSADQQSALARLKELEAQLAAKEREATGQ